jgi:hypothetical protein
MEESVFAGSIRDERYAIRNGGTWSFVGHNVHHSGSRWRIFVMPMPWQIQYFNSCGS